MAAIFFSYSHVDEDLRDRLETALTMLKRQGFVETWHDRRIPAGDDIGNTIDAAIERADIILLLVSPEFLASAYCYEREMMRAMERHEAGEARVIPVILRPCDWKSTPFGKLLAVPKDGLPVTKHADYDDAFLDITNAIKSIAGAAAVAPQKNVTATPAPPAPRSSNLRMKKTYTQADEDAFVDQAFAFMARFFEGSLDELRNRNSNIETRFKRVDTNTFTAIAYRDGKVVSRCRIFLGSAMLGGGIAYSNDDRSDGHSWNESMSVVHDDESLSMKPLGAGSRADSHLTFEGAAEAYWARFMEPLQR